MSKEVPDPKKDILASINETLDDVQLYMKDSEIQEFVQEAFEQGNVVVQTVKNYLEYFNDPAVIQLLAKSPTIDIMQLTQALQNCLSSAAHTAGSLVQIANLKVIINASPKIITRDPEIIT